MKNQLVESGFFFIYFS